MELFHILFAKSAKRMGHPAKSRIREVLLCANILIQWNVRGHNWFVLLPRLPELNLNGILKRIKRISATMG